KRLKQARSGTSGGGSRQAPALAQDAPACRQDTRRANGPDEDDQAQNPRARAALLRVAIRTGAAAAPPDLDALGLPRVRGAV
ncbi:MAG: hypothetical protein P3W95_002965, partial [Tepidimonas taiwanensis]|nr:hypothetical protein [Tepidimonas taiwanensis]